MGGILEGGRGFAAGRGAETPVFLKTVPDAGETDRTSTSMPVMPVAADGAEDPEGIMMVVRPGGGGVPAGAAANGATRGGTEGLVGTKTVARGTGATTGVLTVWGLGAGKGGGAEGAATRPGFGAGGGALTAGAPTTARRRRGGGGGENRSAKSLTDCRARSNQLDWAEAGSKVRSVAKTSTSPEPIRNLPLARILSLKD
ncbi:hypothetical protein MNBD_ALPHA09-1446 [hydrothermal vent metagenome]|uniref:Uncharacterized protein n=1 Tax=hydrothermal vent metagenome TaxID=652676 RepID=A0A3B0T8L2_9ZZZZ